MEKNKFLGPAHSSSRSVSRANILYFNKLPTNFILSVVKQHLWNLLYPHLSPASPALALRSIDSHEVEVRTKF